MGLKKTVFGKTNSERPFIMQVEGTSFTIPTSGTGYNYKIQTDDNQVFTGVTGNKTITFLDSGLHLIKITGAFPTIHFNNTGDKLKLKDIKKWGNIQWTSFTSSFQGCSNLQITATDAPNLSNVSSLYFMFLNCTTINPSNGINNWNTSNVTSMFGMFANCTAFNQPINSWNVSSVTDIGSMFSGATAFNQPLNSWNTSSMINMVQVFYTATAFNQPLNSWNTSNVTNMGGMFNGATAFNQPLNNWNVSSVTNMGGGYGGLFSGAVNFNQNIGNWNTSSVTDMSFMFQNCTAFNQNIGNWNIASVATMQNFMSTKTPSTFSTTNLDAIYNGWGVQPIEFPNISFNSAKYTSAGASGRAQIISFGCAITDGGQTP